MKKACLLLLITVSLSACHASVDTPDARIHGDGYRIDIDGNGYKGGKHCPPGHAMKGWC